MVGAPVIDDNGPDRFVRTSRIKAAHSRIVGIDRITSAQLIFLPEPPLRASPSRELSLFLTECSCLTWCTEVQRRGAPGKGTWNRPEAVADVFGAFSEIYARFVRFSPIRIKIQRLLSTVITYNLTLTVVWHWSNIQPCCFFRLFGVRSGCL